MIGLDPSSSAFVDWGFRDRTRGWQPLKDAVASTLLNFGFQEKQIVFVSANRTPQLGDYVIMISPPIKPNSLSVDRVIDVRHGGIVMRRLAEIDIIKK